MHAALVRYALEQGKVSRKAGESNNLRALVIAPVHELANTPDVAEGRLLEIGGYAVVVYFVDAAAVLSHRNALSPVLGWIRAESAVS